MSIEELMSEAVQGVCVETGKKVWVCRGFWAGSKISAAREAFYARD